MSDKFTKQDLDDAMNKLGMMRYFPSDPVQQGEIKTLLAKMVPHKEALDWLVSQCVNAVPSWPGPYELRAILGTKYGTADGIPAGWSETPGFRACDGEAKYLARESERQQQELSDSSRKMLYDLARKMPKLQ